MAHSRRADSRFAGHVANRTADVEITVPAFCGVCGDAFLPNEERELCFRYPSTEVTAWCMRCWVTLLLHAKEGLVDCNTAS
jgi:hypothetical protein